MGLISKYSWIVLLTVCSVVFGNDANPNWSPNMEILEIISSPDNTTEQIRIIPKKKNSEIIVGEDVSSNSRLVIKCNATFPVQIVYMGAGRPEFTTFTNVQWRENPQMPLTFEAEASLGLLGFQDALRPEDTGNYSCRSIQNATIQSYYYIYVPGYSLFTSPEDDYNSEIYFTQRDKEVWIPCAVAHPSAIVSLHKTASGKLQCPPVSAFYNPHRGFRINVKDTKTPEGVYLCIGSHNENFKMMEYKLIATNSNHSENGKHPCRPSPCGKKAACSVMDGFPTCYCTRGMSGNPYTVCGQTNNDRCHSNTECTFGQFCVQGKCTSDPCQLQPSPCGRGSTCSSNGGRPRCNCDVSQGYEGKPPHCLRKCQSNEDCTNKEICSRTHCQDPCPNRCGSNAECQVIQSSRFNKTILCTCPPGYTGDPEEKCYNVGNNPQETHCPLGFIGPGPPNCRRKECSENYDCPPNHYCTAEKRCADSVPDQCGRVCGLNAICQLSAFRSKTGDPFVRCFNLTTSTNLPLPPIQHDDQRDPCDSNPCPRNSVCTVKYIFGRVNSLAKEFECVYPITAISRPHDPSPSPPPFTPTTECFEDPDCPRGYECVARYCFPKDANEEQQPQCRRRCGINALCVHGQCSCRKNSVGDPHIACREELTPCNPSPCSNFAECREINGKAACRCILGYEGDAFTRCSPSRNSFEPNEPIGVSERRNRPLLPPPPPPSSSNNNNRPFSYNPGFVDDNKNYVHSRFSGGSTSTRPSFNNVGHEYPKDRPHRRDECDMNQPDDCGPPDYKCRRDRRDGIAKCVCSSHRCGYMPENDQHLPNGVIYGRYCSVDEDCRFPEVCSNATLTCYNPCGFEHSPCARVAFSECRIIDRKAICSCRRGYVGNPANGLDCRRDFGGSSSSERLLHNNNNNNFGSGSSGSSNRPIVHCDYEKGIGCDNRSECRLMEGGVGHCVCGQGLAGEYPDCRLRCRTNRDCFNAHECWRNECHDACERNKCGTNALCRVIDHKSICECNPKFIGDPWVNCNPNPDARQKGFELKCEGSKCNFFK